MLQQKQNLLLCKTGGRAVYCFLYSSIEYMFVKPNKKRVETNTEQLLN